MATAAARSANQSITNLVVVTLGLSGRIMRGFYHAWMSR
jgi:hypothetical protein